MVGEPCRRRKFFGLSWHGGAWFDNLSVVGIDSQPGYNQANQALCTALSHLTSLSLTLPEAGHLSGFVYDIWVEHTVAEDLRTSSRNHGWRAPPEAKNSPTDYNAGVRGPISNVRFVRSYVLKDALHTRARKRPRVIDDRCTLCPSSPHFSSRKPTFCVS